MGSECNYKRFIHKKNKRYICTLILNTNIMSTGTIIGRKNLTVEEAEKAIIDARGIIAVAAKHLGITRKTLYDYMNENESLQQARKQGRETFVDMAEGALIKNIKKGREASIIFALKTIGKDRGYVERIEIRDQSKIDDAINKATDDELFDLINKANDRIKNAE